uniref:Uncharacterized protein n=1 Tax=Callorhinchus milii TaxID=7868 RepID=A0A4W3HPX7_CALMI|eukprot:gi/632947083/ref/XP_007888879.1/ PREDICTED: amyotrophic lateral sclerosis 2 chromosomal region candidate gene 12 protein [Callorhinchus milii]
MSGFDEGDSSADAPSCSLHHQQRLVRGGEASSKNNLVGKKTPDSANNSQTTNKLCSTGISTALELCRKCEKGKTFPEHSTKTGESVVISPGYVLSRTKSRVHATLCDEFFGHPHDTVQVVERHVPEHKVEDLVVDLQNQISQLVQMLEEERCNQVTIRTKYVTEIVEESKELKRQHEEEISIVEEKHSAEIQQLQIHFKEKLKVQMVDAQQQYDELKDQLDFLDATFVTYKETIIEEMNENWSKKEEGFRRGSTKVKDKELFEQKQVLLNIFEQEKETLETKNQNEITFLKEHHEREIQEVTTKYNAMFELVGQLEKADQHIEDLRIKLAEKTQALELQSIHLKEVEVALRAANIEILEYQKNFDAKVSEVDDKYWNYIHFLLNQNIDLRHRLTLVSADLCAAQATVEEKHKRWKQQVESMAQQKYEEGSEEASPPPARPAIPPRSRMGSTVSKSPPAPPSTCLRKGRPYDEMKPLPTCEHAYDHLRESNADIPDLRVEGHKAP